MNDLETKSKYYENIKKAIEYFEENYKYQPSLEELSLHLKLSKFHFCRIFKEYVGVSPMQFLQATTLAHAKEKLETSKSILETSIEVGLSSSSRLHELFVNFEGVSPNEYKKMGMDLEITYGFGFSTFGKTMIANTKKGICSLEFYDDSYEDLLTRLKKTWKNAIFIQDDKQAQLLLNKIFIEKEKIKLFVKGTNFQINVWKALLKIPKQEVCTYSSLAKSINNEKAIRAVSSAIGANHIAYLIPCHRVISKSAAMSGYRWGIKRKKVILAYEDNII